MQTPNLIVICGVAFVAVFFVLTVLAGVMRTLTALFPQRDEEATGQIEPALIAAISEGMKATYPGTRVTEIEEVK
jgi:Na+-transporting methylmalonyl-CoA/oxaloacetate decarboxylase gamma subunit